MYFRSVGAAQIRDFSKLFRWKKLDTEKTIKTLEKLEVIRTKVNIDNKDKNWVVLTNLITYSTF